MDISWIKNLFDLNRLPARIVFVIWVTAFILVFASDSFLDMLSLKDFKLSYKKFIGVTFLISTGLLVVMIFTWGSSKINISLSKKKWNRQLNELITNIDMHEKAVLREFYIQGKSTLKLPYEDSTVAGLVHKGILLQVGEIGSMSMVGMILSFKINERAMEHISYDLLDLPKGEPSPEQIEIIRRNRPRWVSELERHMNLFTNF